MPSKLLQVVQNKSISSRAFFAYLQILGIDSQLTTPKQVAPASCGIHDRPELIKELISNKLPAEPR
jgi:hypothetical protein